MGFHKNKLKSKDNFESVKKPFDKKKWREQTYSNKAKGNFNKIFMYGKIKCLNVLK